MKVSTGRRAQRHGVSNCQLAIDSMQKIRSAFLTSKDTRCAFVLFANCSLATANCSSPFFFTLFSLNSFNSCQLVQFPDTSGRAVVSFVVFWCTAACSQLEQIFHLQKELPGGLGEIGPAVEFLHIVGGTQIDGGERINPISDERIDLNGVIELIVLSDQP